MIEDAQYIACDNADCANHAAGRCKLRTINLRRIRSNGSPETYRELGCLNFIRTVRPEKSEQYSLAMVE
jgi:hypothetical protein